MKDDLKQRPCGICGKPATPGKRTCAECRGEGVTIVPRSEPERKQQRPLIGVAQAAPKKPAHNRKPRVKVLCACGCGRYFARVIGGYWESRIYYNKECRKGHYQGSGRKDVIVVTPEADAAIRELYETKVGKDRFGHVKLLAAKLGLPAWKVSRRAVELGVLPTVAAEPEWSEEEKNFAKANAKWSIYVIVRKMKEAGYHRTPNAVKVMLNRMGGSGQFRNAYSARDLGRCFGVDSHQVIEKWLAAGLIHAERRGTLRTPEQHGDEWVILPEDVRRFVILNTGIIDFRKLDKYWLVSLLTEGTGSHA
jgi:hypothetical protein